MAETLILFILAIAGSCALLASPGLLDKLPQPRDLYLPSRIPNLAAKGHEHLMGDLDDVRFLLWTNRNPSSFYRLLPHDLDNLARSPFNGSLPTIVIYHGFNDNGLTGWIIDSKTELLKLGDANVISVDWEKLVVSPWYNYAYQNVFRVGNYTAGLLDWLVEAAGLATERVHVVGHSLGAHTAGITARNVTAGQVARVTGLDPAGPLFYTAGPGQRLDKSDAAFVDVIHANSGSILEGCIGLSEPVGHVDFYPNGGMHQPGCQLLDVTTRNDWMDLFGGCSHHRTTSLWVESISARTPEQMFVSWPCTDWDTFFTGECPECGGACLDMGLTTTAGSGLYFLRTNPTSPYALGDIQ